ncbi:MFS transporter [Muricoccus radiodurans]|uniref:MFS transporter n=1 Tax=Muricoccus radiodurans TaxID=2231721 RepID=UPI003CFA0C3D
MPPTSDAEAAFTRRLVALYGLTGFATSLAGRSLDPILPEVAAHYAAALETVALLASAFALPYAFIQPVLGPVGDALGKRRIIATGTALTGLALLASAFAPTLGLLFVLRAVAGMTAGGIYPLIIATFGDRVPVASRQVALSRVLAWSTAGQIAGGVASGLVAEILDWRTIIAVGALPVLLAAVILWLDLRREPDRPPGRLDVAAAIRRYREILSIPAARHLFLSVGTEGVVIYGTFPFVAGLVAAWGLGGAAQAGIAIAAFGAAGIAYGLLSGGLLRTLGIIRMVQLAGVLGAAGFGLMAATGWLAGQGKAVPLGVTPMVLGFFILGLGYFMTHNSLQTRVTEVYPKARGSAVALHAFSFFVGQSVGPLLFGTLLGGLGAVAALALLGAAMLVFGLVLSRVLGAASNAP